MHGVVLLRLQFFVPLTYWWFHFVYSCGGEAYPVYSYICTYWSPLQVNTKVEGASPLHLAIMEGFMSVLKTIIHFKPDLNIDVS